MKNLLILGTIFLTMNAFAGNEKGNGGGVHFCAQEKQIELYDIYEAQARYGYDIKNDNSPVDVQIARAIAKIKKSNPFIAKSVEEQLNYLRKGHTIIREKIKLTPIGDAKILLVDEGCSYQQLANWDEVSGNLLVKKEYLDKMDNTNKAALYIHETLYKVARNLNLLKENADGSTNSDEVRRIVGEIFSTDESLSLMWDIEDPQVGIERKRKVYESEEKFRTNLLMECHLAETETSAARNVVLKSYSHDDFNLYMEKYLNATSTCIKNLEIAKSLESEIFVSIDLDIKLSRVATSINEILWNMSGDHAKMQQTSLSK